MLLEDPKMITRIFHLNIFCLAPFPMTALAEVEREVAIKANGMLAILQPTTILRIVISATFTF